MQNKGNFNYTSGNMIIVHDSGNCTAITTQSGKSVKYRIVLRQ